MKTLMEHIKTLSDDRVRVHSRVCRVIAYVHPGVVEPLDVGAYTGNGRVAFSCLVHHSIHHGVFSFSISY